MKSNSSKKNFITRYLGLISALTCFVIIVLSIGAFNYLNSNKLSEYSLLLNTIGQQKTLSQKISKDILLLQQEFVSDEKFNQSLFQELLNNKKSFQSILSALENGGTIELPNNEGTYTIESIKNSYGDSLKDIYKAWSPLNGEIEGLSKVFKDKIKNSETLDNLLVSRKNKTYVLSEDKDSLPNDIINNTDSTRLAPVENNNLKNSIGSDLQETTRVLKNNNLALLSSIDKLNNQINQVMLEQKKNYEMIQLIAFAITVLLFIALLFFFFGKLVKSDLLSFREEKEKTAILENAREGLFLMDENWIIKQKGSNALNSILGIDIKLPISFLEIIQPLVDEKTLKNAKEFVKILFTKKEVKESLIATLNPLKLIEVTRNTNIHNNQFQKKQFLSISFNKVKDENGDVSKLLVTILDTTEQKKLEEKLKEEQHKSSSQFDFLLKIIQSNDKEAIVHFFKQLQDKVCDQNEMLKTTETDETQLSGVLNQIQREIHTLKAESTLLNLNVFQDMLHEFEDKLSDIKKKKPIKAEDLHIISFYHKDILEKTGSTLEAIEASSGGSFIRLDNNTSYTQQLENDLNVLLKNNTEGLHKKAQLLVKLNGVNNLSESKKDTIRSIFMHMINNSIAHGIETPEIRNQKNKHPIGTIKIYDENIEEDFQSHIVFHVIDDGAGIDFNKIREKALKLGYPVEKDTPQQLLKFIFMPNFSTIDEVTKIAGRGIGMDFIKSEIEKLGGKIGLRLREGSYTEFYFSIPVND